MVFTTVSTIRSMVCKADLKLTVPNAELECLLPIYLLCGGFHQRHLYMCEGLFICYQCMHNMKHNNYFMYDFMASESEKFSKNGCLLVQCLFCNSFLCHLDLSESLDFIMFGFKTCHTHYQ